MNIFEFYEKKVIRFSSESIKKCIECPDPWKLFKGNCVLYFKSSRSFSWNEARIECKKNGADLLDVQPEHYLEFIDRFTKIMQITDNFHVFISYSYQDQVTKLFKYIN